MRLNLPKLLKKAKLTPYALAKATGLSLPTVYRLAKPDGRFTRLDSVTIDKVCKALGCTPGQLITRDAD